MLVSAGLVAGLLSSCCQDEDCTTPAFPVLNIRLSNDLSAGGFTLQEAGNTEVVFCDSVTFAPLDTVRLVQEKLRNEGLDWSAMLGSDFRPDDMQMMQTTTWLVRNQLLGTVDTISRFNWDLVKVKTTCGSCNKTYQLDAATNYRFLFNGQEVSGFETPLIKK